VIKSKFILDIFDLLFDDHKATDLLTKQIDFLTEGEIEHTGVGLFINFNSDKTIQAYKVDRNLLVDESDDPNLLEMIDGVEIKNDSQNILADAIVHLKNGVIDSLEIWNKGGDNYPLIEPEHYEMTQTWRDVSKNKIIRK
jgi:hypothetical protein